MNAAKSALRAQVAARRQTLSKGTLVLAAATVRRHVVAAVRGAGARQVCAYVPFGSEPGSRILLDALTVGGVEVLLPVVLPDKDLDWAVYTGPRSLTGFGSPAGRGPREPLGRRLGVGAVTAVDLLIVPALAVDPAGGRLGRGGGSYDRALARVAPEVTVVALLHDGERVAKVPTDLHDRPVTHVVTPAGGWQPVSP